MLAFSLSISPNNNPSLLSTFTFAHRSFCMNHFKEFALIWEPVFGVPLDFIGPFLISVYPSLGTNFLGVPIDFVGYFFIRFYPGLGNHFSGCL